MWQQARLLDQSCLLPDQRCFGGGWWCHWLPGCQAVPICAKRLQAATQQCGTGETPYGTYDNINCTGPASLYRQRQGDLTCSCGYKRLPWTLGMVWLKAGWHVNCSEGLQHAACKQICCNAKLLVVAHNVEELGTP